MHDRGREVKRMNKLERAALSFGATGGMLAGLAIVGLGALIERLQLGFAVGFGVAACMVVRTALLMVRHE